MRKIYKYALPQISNIVEVPTNSEWMKVAIQNNVPHVWMAVTDAPTTEKWEFTFLMTGHEITKNDGNYLDTLFLNSGIVLHLFYKGVK